MHSRCIPVGCVPSAAVAVGGGVGVRVSAWVVVCPGRGVCVSQHALGRGVCAPVHVGIHTPPPPVDRILDTLVKTLPFRNYVADGKNVFVLYDGLFLKLLTVFLNV